MAPTEAFIAASTMDITGSGTSVPSEAGLEAPIAQAVLGRLR